MPENLGEMINFLRLFHTNPRLMCVGTKTRDALMKSRTSVRTGGTAHMQNYKTEELVRQAKRQDADATWINMVRDDIKFSDPDLPQSENKSDEDVKKVFDELFGDAMITCTVHFTDGTSETIEIEPGVIVTTATKNGEEYREVNLTFERK